MDSSASHGFNVFEVYRRFCVGAGDLLRLEVELRNWSYSLRSLLLCKKQGVCFQVRKGKLKNPVPETLPEEVLGKMSAPPKSDVPIITPNELAEADGLIFGFPTRFGMMCAQFKAFFDATAGLWGTQELAGKPAGIFYNTDVKELDSDHAACSARDRLILQADPSQIRFREQQLQDDAFSIQKMAEKLAALE